MKGCDCVLVRKYGKCVASKLFWSAVASGILRDTAFANMFRKAVPLRLPPVCHRTPNADVTSPLQYILREKLSFKPRQIDAL